MSSKRQRESDDKKFLPKKPWPAREQPNKTVKTLRYALGYEVRTEIIDNIGYMGRPFKKNRNKSGRFMTMRSAYTPKGDYLGDPRHARYIFKRGITRCEKTKPDHCVCSIGFNPTEQKWYGWSHRAICGFGKGDRIYNERWKKQRADGKTPHVKHGDRVIKTMAHAKLAASRFACSVS